MNTPDFARMVPGFDFLQSLMKGASASLPGMSQWIAPTLDAEEVDKRIQDLRTVQFWLEQNAKMLAATIQALEVQRMTLATLQTMNVPMSELRESMKIEPSAFTTRSSSGAAGTGPEAPAAARPLAGADRPEPGRAQAPLDKSSDRPADEPEKAATPAVDPLQWWGALTRQFADLAAKTIQEMPSEAANVFAKATGAARESGSGKADAAKPRAASGKADAPKRKAQTRSRAGGKPAGAGSGADGS